MKLRILFVVLFMANSSVAKRMAPKKVESLIAGDYVYTVPHWGFENGMQQNGGYINVVDLTISCKFLTISCPKREFAQKYANTNKP